MTGSIYDSPPVANIVDAIRAYERDLIASRDEANDRAFLANEVAASMRAASTRLADMLGVPLSPNETISDLVDKVVLKFNSQAEQAKSDLLTSAQRNLELERELGVHRTTIGDAKDALEKVLQLPPARTRTLPDAVRETVEMVKQAQQMVREHL